MLDLTDPSGIEDTMKTPCDKYGYLTKREAARALETARAAAASGYSRRAERRTYRCGCGLYHLTSAPHRRFDAHELQAVGA